MFISWLVKFANIPHFMILLTFFNKLLLSSYIELVGTDKIQIQY